MELETNNIIVGAGLISLDVLIRDGQRVPISYYVGGTCGNVMMILSHMGWDAYPIARLDGTKDGVRVLEDMKKHRVHTDFVSTQDGKTPVIVQRNFINKDGIPTHKFESRNNIGRFYLDFKSLTLKQANEVIEKIDFVPKVFFFDRVSPAIFKLAATFKEKGSVIFFEPSSRGGNVSLFNKANQLLASIMKWDAPTLASERAALEFMGSMKYDAYDRYMPGMRFMSSLVQWLNDIEEEDRDEAYKFIKEKLVFISSTQMK